jgi:hypothetical protein
LRELLQLACRKRLRRRAACAITHAITYSERISLDGTTIVSPRGRRNPAYVTRVKMAGGLPPCPPFRE